jgi:hypothetical protein
MWKPDCDGMYKCTMTEQSLGYQGIRMAKIRVD